MDEKDVRAPAFCPACGTKLRRSLAERLGISENALHNLLKSLLVVSVIIVVASIICGTIAFCSWNSRQLATEMVAKGYVQSTKVLDPATAWRAGRYVTEWTKDERPEKEEKP